QDTAGAELLTAIALGLELCLRIGRAGYDVTTRTSRFLQRGQDASTASNIPWSRTARLRSSRLSPASWPPPFAPPPPLPVARHCSAASLLLWRSLTSHARASSASVPHLPDADQSALQPVAGHEISQVPTRSFRT